MANVGLGIKKRGDRSEIGGRLKELLSLLSGQGKIAGDPLRVTAGHIPPDRAGHHGEKHNACRGCRGTHSPDNRERGSCRLLWAGAWRANGRLAPPDRGTWPCWPVTNPNGWNYSGIHLNGASSAAVSRKQMGPAGRNIQVLLGHIQRIS